MVKEFAAIGGTGIRITGGEPLCHPHWLDIVRFSSAQGFETVTLQTNAMLLTDEHLAILCELDFPGFSLQISLDGATAQAHDLVRGEGSYRHVVQRVKKLVQAGLGGKVSLFFTEMRHNLEEIPELLDVAASIGVGSVVTGAIVLCGRAAVTSSLAPADVGQYLRLLARYDNDEHFRDLYARIGTVAALEWRRGDAVRQESCTFLENPYLTSSGRLYPCLLCHCDAFSVSGVLENGLAASFVDGVPLWSSLLRISRSRAATLAQCQTCPGASACAGGCMGRTWGSCGSLLAADDRCAVRRAVYEKYHVTC
jgi:radical SAM protein with 4Fe4S-binding SPASM domain